MDDLKASREVIQRKVANVEEHVEALEDELAESHEVLAKQVKLAGAAAFLAALLVAVVLVILTTS